MRRDDRAGTPLQDDLQAVHVPMLLAAPHEVQTRPATEMHLAQYHQQYNTHTHTHLTAFEQDYPGGPVPGETFAHSHPSGSPHILCQLPPSTTMYSIILVQFMCLTVLFHNLSSGSLWSSFYPGNLYFISSPTVSYMSESDWDEVLRPIQHTTGHFGDIFPANLLTSTEQSKPN